MFAGRFLDDRGDFEQSLIELKVNVELLKEAALPKQPGADCHRIRKANLDRYGTQAFDHEINSMEIRHVLSARYTLKRYFGAASIAMPIMRPMSA